MLLARTQQIFGKRSEPTSAQLKNSESQAIGAGRCGGHVDFFVSGVLAWSLFTGYHDE